MGSVQEAADERRPEAVSAGRTRTVRNKPVYRQEEGQIGAHRRATRSAVNTGFQGPLDGGPVSVQKPALGRALKVLVRLPKQIAEKNSEGLDRTRQPSRGYLATT